MYALVENVLRPFVDTCLPTTTTDSIGNQNVTNLENENIGLKRKFQSSLVLKGQQAIFKYEIIKKIEIDQIFSSTKSVIWLFQTYKSADDYC